jgi:hypothetical protein
MAHKTVLLLFLLLILIGISMPTALAQAPEVTLEIQPQSVELGAAEEGRVTVLIRNNSDKKIENLSVSAFANEPLVIGVPEATDTTVLPYSSAIWQLNVAQPATSAVSGSVFVTAAYTWPAGDDSGEALRGVATGKLDVTVPAAIDQAEVVTVEAKSSLTNLNEQRDGVVYLIINSLADFPLEIAKIDGRSPEFVTLTITEPQLPATLAPNSSLVVLIEVEADPVVQPGKHLLVFTAETSWQQEGRPQTASLVAAHEVEVGVFGESAILTLLGVPAFFLLPGLLLLATYKILLSWSDSSADPSILNIKEKPVEFLVSSITVSLIAMLVYPWLTGQITGVERNYLEAYGLNDVLYLWFASILAGILLFAIVYSVRWLIAEIEERRLAAQTFMPGDDPLTVLRRLQKRGLSLDLDAAWISYEARPYMVNLLQRRDDQAAKLWVAPQMCVVDRSKLAKEARDAVTAAIAAGDIEAILKQRDQIELAWKEEEEQDRLWPEEVNIPMEIEATAISMYLNRNERPGLLLADC